MRILILTNYYPPLEIGGWEQLTRDVAHRLRERGHAVRVLTSNHRAAEVAAPEPDVFRVLHLESPNHLHYHPLYTLHRRGWERDNRRQIRRAVATFRPDVIFVNGMWNLPVTVAQEAEACLPGRVVYYIASHWPTEPDAHNAYWQSPAERAWLNVPKRWLGWLARPLLPAQPRNRLDFACVLCVSEFMRRYMVQEAGVPPARVHVVHNGIDPAAFPMRPLDEDAPVLRLLYAGRLSPDKGVHTAIEGMALLKQQYPDAPATLTIVGGGAPDYVTRLENMVQSLGLAEVVTLRRQVPREQMPGILQAHHVLLFTSIWPEPLARMVQEAMACGLVVIGTTTGGTPEILTDGENGLTFEAGNAAMLVEKVARVLRDPSLRPRLAHAARRTVEERFTMQRMVEELEGWFEVQIHHPGVILSDRRERRISLQRRE